MRVTYTQQDIVEIQRKAFARGVRAVLRGDGRDCNGTWVEGAKPMSERYYPMPVLDVLHNSANSLSVLTDELCSATEPNLEKVFP